ncbi:MAG TPA: VOC family protein [Herpetosiphonaceae bacterium]
MTQPRMQFSATVLDAPDAPALASFYERLLGWKRTMNDTSWVTITPPDGGTGLSFQTEPNFVSPTWPSVPGSQLMLLHLDIHVEDLDAAVEWAVQAGARIADFQPQDNVRVMLDPVGHPFCLFVD